jgi:hypothetical protein
LRGALAPEVKVHTKEEHIHRALTLTQFLDALYAAAEVFPVELVRHGDDRTAPDGSTVLLIRSRQDDDREALSTALNLRPLAQRLETALLGDNVQKEGWILTDSKTLGERKLHDTEWEFQQPEKILGSHNLFIHRYEFCTLDNRRVPCFGWVGRSRRAT